MTVFAGQGDARRSLSLLWAAPGHPRPGRSGPKPALSVEAIVTAGLAVADAEGMAALSMRAVGEQLGRTAMALYTYVPGKAELLDLMHDRVLGELPTSYDLTAGWRPAATAWAEDAFACYLRHPWVLQISQARPVLGPAELGAMETLLRILTGAGLAPVSCGAWSPPSGSSSAVWPGRPPRPATRRPPPASPTPSGGRPARPDSPSWHRTSRTGSPS